VENARIPVDPQLLSELCTARDVLVSRVDLGWRRIRVERDRLQEIPVCRDRCQRGIADIVVDAAAERIDLLLGAAPSVGRHLEVLRARLDAIGRDGLAGIEGAKAAAADPESP